MNRPEKMTPFILKACLRAAQLSQQSYLSKSFLRTEPAPRFFFSEGDAFGFLEIAGDSAWLVFRGTVPSSKQQVKADSLARMNEEWEVGQVHLGFQNELDLVWEDVLNYVETHAAPQLRRIYVCGHSLGGAMATLAASRLLCHSLKRGDSRLAPSGLITFGSPRTGDIQFASFMNALNVGQDEERGRVGIWRFRNNNDIVTRVPSYLMGFRHCGKTVYVDHRENIHFDPWLSTLILSGFRGAGWRILRDSVGDHSMVNYLKTLEKHGLEEGLS